MKSNRFLLSNLIKMVPETKTRQFYSPRLAYNIYQKEEIIPTYWSWILTFLLLIWLHDAIPSSTQWWPCAEYTGTCWNPLFASINSPLCSWAHSRQGNMILWHGWSLLFFLKLILSFTAHNIYSQCASLITAFNSS